MKFDPMPWVLGAVAIFVVVSFWRAHCACNTAFNAFDLITENGKVSKIALAFMLAFAVTTWILIDQQIKGTLSEGVFGLYLGAWVAPLVAKVVFNKVEMPSTTVTATVTKTETTKE